MLLWGSASSVKYCVYKLYIMYINWDVSLYKLMVYSLQIKLFPPVFEIGLNNSYTLDAFYAGAANELEESPRHPFQRGKQKKFSLNFLTGTLPSLCPRPHACPLYLRSLHCVQSSHEAGTQGRGSRSHW